MDIYPSIEEYIEACDKPGLQDKASHSSSENRGTRTFAEALKIARQGWAEGAEQAKALGMRIASDLHVHEDYKKTWKLSVQGGGNLVLPNYIQGKPECFRHYARVSVPKFIHIVFNGTASWGVTTESLIKKGVACAAVVDMLETHGFRCKVDKSVVNSGVSDKSYIESITTLKDYGESLDIDRLVFFLAHPSSFRRLEFARWEYLGIKIGGNFREEVGIDNNYGLQAESRDQGDIYFQKSRLHTGWDNEEEAEIKIREILKAQGLELD